MDVDSQEEEEEEEEDEYQNDEEDEEEDEEDEQEDKDYFLSRERKIKIIETILKICEKTEAAANIVAFIEAWSSHDALVDWMESNPDFKVRLKA